MIDRISVDSNIRNLTTWNNGATGAIVDIDRNCIFRFIQYPIDDKGGFHMIYKPHEERQQPVVCYGFVGWLFRNISRGTLDIFDGYYNIRKENFQKAHKDDADVWKRDLLAEFVQVHEAEERKRIEDSKVIFDYLPDCDIRFISERCENYMSYVHSKLAVKASTLTNTDSILSERALRYFDRAITKGYMQKSGNGYIWNQPKVRLGYFVRTIYSPDGCSEIKYKLLEELFGENRLDNHINNAVNGKDDLKWKTKMREEIFFD